MKWKDALRQFERQFLETALKEHGSVSAAARAIGRHRTNMHERMKLYGLHSPLPNPFNRRGRWL